MILGIYGSGGLGRALKDYIEDMNEWDELVFIDDMENSGMYNGILRMPFEKFIKKYTVEQAKVIIAIGEPIHREKIFEKVKSAGYTFANVICEGVHISKSAKLGEGIFVCRGTTIQSDAIIGDNVCIADNVVVAHDCKIGKHAVLSIGVLLSGYVEVEDLAYVGMGAVLRDRVHVGSRAKVGMGSVVMRDVPEKTVVLGNPARVSRKVEEEDKVFGEYYHG